MKKWDTLKNKDLAMHVSRMSIGANILLAVLKLFAGIFAHSGAMVSDAVHTLSDVVSTVAVMIGVTAAGKEADRDHPYGHERLECVAALLLAALLLATGIGIGYSGIMKITGGNYDALVLPGRLALIAALLSILVKEVLYWYTKAAAKRIRSGALMADAWHHRSDALSSIGSFVGILGARLGFPVLDAVASVVICVFICKAAIDIFRDAIGKMTDKACDEKISREIRELAEDQSGVLGIDLMKTRLFGDRIYVDLEIRADRNASLCEAHAIAEKTHDAIENHFPQVKHCMIHVNPAPEPEQG